MTAKKKNILNKMMRTWNVGNRASSVVDFWNNIPRKHTRVVLDTKKMLLRTTKLLMYHHLGKITVAKKKSHE